LRQATCGRVAPQLAADESRSDSATRSPSITPATDGLEVHRTFQLDPNLKLSQTTTHVTLMQRMTVIVPMVNGEAE
jgi:hypothetical protein